MRASIRTAVITLLAVWLALPGLARAEDEANDPKWCRVCHRDEAFSTAGMARTVHSDLVCRDCHTTYHFNPHEKVVESPDDLPPALAKLAPRDPPARAECTTCHDDVVDEPGQLVHSMNGGKARPPITPYCLDCHGEPHSIAQESAMPPAERRHAMNQRCIRCHGDEERIKESGARLSATVISTYEHSVHARKLALGSPDAPGCADCHGGHALIAMRTDGVARCAGCHPGATADFVQLATHERPSKDGRRVAYYTQKCFAWLTFLTMFFLAMHVLLDLLSSLRLFISRARGQ